MSFTDRMMSLIGYQKTNSDACACEDNVSICDGKIVGNPYAQFGVMKRTLSDAELDAAYSKVSCIGASIDLVANNMQMIEPVFFNDDKREFDEYPSDRRLKSLKRLFAKPNSFDNRKQFIQKSVKNYLIHGAVYFIFVFQDGQPVSIKVIDNNLVSYFTDIPNSRIGSFLVENAGAFSGEYIFDGSYYSKFGNVNYVLAPYINTAPDFQYLPCSPLLGAGLETLMYWYGCFHNKSLLENGARPSLVFLIKSLLNPKLKEELRNEIRIKHSGAGNAGNAIIVDGAADKDVKQFSQNNRDMEFNEVLKSARSAICDRLGTNWVMDKDVSAKDYPKALEMFYDMTVCPLFQGIYNHLFDVFKYYNTGYNNMSVYYLEQDIPALAPRFLDRMSKMPNLGIFTLNERRKMMNYKPLEDERGDELVVQSVSVYQQGMDTKKQNVTSFSGNGNEEKQ